MEGGSCEAGDSRRTAPENETQLPAVRVIRKVAVAMPSTL